MKSILIAKAMMAVYDFRDEQRRKVLIIEVRYLYYRDPI
jgi:hypothetical protein